MKFPYRKIPKDGAGKRPQLRITVKYKDKECATWAMIDSGADVCACPAEIGENIGLKIESVLPLKLKAANGKVVDVYVHKVRIKVAK